MSPAPVVVVGANEMGLAAARSLHGRHGARVLVVHTGAGPRQPPAYTRHAEVVTGPSVTDPERLTAFLLELAERFPVKPVLVPAQDGAVLLIHRYRERLAAGFRFVVWDSDVLLDIGSKSGLAPVAARFELPVPETFVPRDRAHLDERMESLEFPQLVKPAFTNEWWSPEALAAGLGKKAIVARTPVELRDVFTRSARVGAAVVIQRIIGGADSDHWSYAAFVGSDGEITTDVVARKLRITPPRFGIGSYVVTAADEEIARIGRDIIRKLGFRGFVSVQLKREGAGGRVYLIELNLRLPMWVELAIAAGADFPWHYYCAALGEQCPHSRARIGHCWMHVGRDFRSMRTYAREGTVAWSQWLRELLARPSVPVLSATDPLPGLVVFWRWVGPALARRLRLGRTRPRDVAAAASRAR